MTCLPPEEKLSMKSFVTVPLCLIHQEQNQEPKRQLRWLCWPYLLMLPQARCLKISDVTLHKIKIYHHEQ
jgi:hypothetical protein